MIAQVLVARRQWTCSGCGVTIHRGEEYLRIRLERFCRRCPP